MHWESHTRAFYAHWISRYLDPREAPWKSVLDHWIKHEYYGGRTALLEAMQPGASIRADLPPQLSYFSAAIYAFNQLRVVHTPPKLTQEIQSDRSGHVAGTDLLT